MWRWTWKSLFREPVALLGSAAGVASAFLLVIFFQGLFAGESGQIVSYLRHAGADVWVAQPGVTNMHMASSFVPDWKQRQIERVAGVARVTPILYINTVVQAGDRKWFSYVVGLEAGGPVGGPWDMATGRARPGRGEAVVPATLARIAGLELGDLIRIADREFRIVGLSNGTFSMANSVCFVARADLAELVSAPGLVSYYLVEATPGVAPEILSRRIAVEVDKLSVQTAAQFIASDYRMAMQMGIELIGLITVIGSVLAALVVAYTVYMHTARRRRELAVIKALGAGRASVYAGALLQALIVTLLGFGAAAAAAQALLPAIAQLAPQISLDITLAALGQAGLAAVVVAIVAALVPAHQVVRIDPLLVFQT